MSKYFDGELLSAYEDLNKEFECKNDNVKLHEKIVELQKQLEEQTKTIQSLVEAQKYLEESASYQMFLDNQKRLKEKIKILNRLKKMYLLERTKNDNYHTEKYGLDKPVKELRKIKLNAKEKEIYYKGFDNCERQFATHIAELQKQLKASEQSQKELAINELLKLSKHFVYSEDEMVSDYDLDCYPSELKEEIERRIRSLKRRKKMTKEELQKIYQTIVLKTNGGIDDYVVALCQIGNAISELDNQQQQIVDLQHRLDVAEKALELCERHHIGFENTAIKEQIEWIETRVKENINYFKDQAEKEIKGENNDSRKNSAKSNSRLFKSTCKS